MQIEIIPLEGAAEEITKAMMNGHTAEPLDSVTIDDGFEITYEGSTIQKGISSEIFKEILEFTLGIGSTVSMGLVTNFIYDILKGKVQKLWINSRETSVGKNEIRKALEEKPKALEEKSQE